MTHELTLQAIEPVTHDTYWLRFDRPDGFEFEPGQAVDLAFQKEGIKQEERAFTMVSDPAAETVEFVIKSYPDHDGVTEVLPELSEGVRATSEEPFGAIKDHGPGVFLAAGAGITPFIAILDKHAREGVTCDHLIFANKADRDIILKDKWDKMSGVKSVYVVEDEATDHVQGRIDKDLLTAEVEGLDQPFYICGPGGFVDACRDALRDMGVKDNHIITEDGW